MNFPVADGPLRDKARIAAGIRRLRRRSERRYVAPMSPRTRKLVGGVIMILFVIVYALLAMALAQARVVQQSGTLVQTVIYAALGLSWILPLLPLIRWMEGRR